MSLDFGITGLFRTMKLAFGLVILQYSLIGAEWSYSGETGPDFWGLLYPACSKARQSPISIKHEKALPDKSLSSFKFFGYNDIQTLNNLTVWNDGYTVTVRVHGDVNIEGGGLAGRYNLQHFHFHWGSQDRSGSEHFLDGVAYPLEMHLVHKTIRHKKISDALKDPTGLAVLGVFAKIGKPHPYFQAIIDNLRLLDIGDYANVRPFPLHNLLPEDTEVYYRYHGSLTTPPCSETVVWTVFKEPIEISEFQIEQLRTLSLISNFTDNYRPIQHLNGRRIYVRKKSLATTIGNKNMFDVSPPHFEFNNITTFKNDTAGSASSIKCSIILVSIAVLLHIFR